VLGGRADAPGPGRKTGRPASTRLIVVSIDAGHGGEDPGARGPSGTNEKDITLAIARKLKERIDREPNMRGVLTRDGDFFIPLHHRVEKARRVNADLFVSIHADAFVRPQARGSSVFALSERGATSAAARWLAKRENEADLIGGVNLDVKDRYLKQTLLDLSQTATINDSLKLGKAVLSELGEINTLHKNSVEQAGFAVLKAPDIPSILVETAFISNPEEESRLRNDAYQTKMADAVFQGIKRYFAKNPPLSRDNVAANR
jgi:N-acetylmuramoyl-L-alanine amidase